MTLRMLAAVALSVAGATAAIHAQANRPASPRGTSATQVGGRYETVRNEPVYQGGKWIELTYGRPIKRGRELWGTGENYGKQLYAGAPVWRAGADVTTRLLTEAPLTINGKALPAGEYSLFIDLKPNNWTFIVSNWPVQSRYDPANKEALWGAYGYTPDKDILRAPMKLETLPHSIDQLTWNFIDMSDAGGSLAITWDKTMASVPFTVGK